MIVTGVDDAGRGSVLGPLVIAGVSVRRSTLKDLTVMGVRDSKRLTPKRREELYERIIEIAEQYCIARIRPVTIDRSVMRHELNHLEAKYMAKVVAELNGDVSYVDSCDVNPQRFGGEISCLSHHNTVRSHHRADSRFVVVSAASVIAKVARDRSVARLRREHDLGSGYPSDHKTMDFLKDYVTENCAVPPFVRKSWKPVQRIMQIVDAK